MLNKLQVNVFQIKFGVSVIEHILVIGKVSSFTSSRARSVCVAWGAAYYGCDWKDGHSSKEKRKKRECRLARHAPISLQNEAFTDAGGHGETVQGVGWLH